MATELTLKDQSVIEIGKEIGDRVGEFQSAGTALVPANQMAPAGAVAAEVQPMNPFESMMAVLSDIREGIYSLVDKFSEGVSLQNQALDQQEMAADAAALGATEADIEAPDEKEKGPSFLDKAKEKAKATLGSFKELLIKGGLIAGLLLLAKGLQKYGKEIAEKITPIVEGIKRFFGVLFDNVGPLFETLFGAVSDLFGAIGKIFKGDFLGAIGDIGSLGVKLVSLIGDSFFSMLEAVLAAFGIDAQWVKDIKMWFRELPENISKMFKAIGEFFTVTIPTKVQEIKDGIANFFDEWLITPFKNFFNSIGTFFTETIPNKVTEIKNSMAAKFIEINDAIIDFALAPFRKIKELMKSLLVGILESVEGLPFIGKKAKALKEKIIGEDDVKTSAKDAKQKESALGDRKGMNSGELNDLEYDEDQGQYVKPENTFNRNKVLREQALSKFKPEKYIQASELEHGSSIDPGELTDREKFKFLRTGKTVNPNELENPKIITPPLTNDNMIIEPKTNGKNLNKEGAEYAAASQGGGGTSNINTGGNTTSSTQNSVNQTIIADETMTGDRSMKDAIYT